jgi:hypothetical protein
VEDPTQSADLGISKREIPRVQAIIDGLSGIALSNEITPQATSVSKTLLEHLTQKLGAQPELALSFDQKLSLMWSACAIGIETEGPLVKDLYRDLHMMNFQRTHNDLTYGQAQKVIDIQLYLTRASEARHESWVKDEKNEALHFMATN